MKRTITDFFELQSKRKVGEPTQPTSVATQQATTSSSTPVEATHIECDSPSYDVGAVEWSKMSEMGNVCFLTKPWCRPTRFQWPYIERKDRGSIRRRHHHHHILFSR